MINKQTGLAVGIALLLFSAWTALTPPGLLGKADAAGYAVCHRIPSHSFQLGGRPLSLCARCTGQYLGFGLVFFYQLLRGGARGGRFPRLAVQAVLLGLLGLYVLDGLNSYLSFSRPGASSLLYRPRNQLRFLSGMGAGISVGAFFLPLFNRIVWAEPRPVRVLSGFWAWGGLVVGAGVLSGMVLSRNPLFLYPLTLAAAAGVVLLLTLAYAVIWTILFHRENTFRTWRDLVPYLALGLAGAVIQIGALDLIRFWVTGTWAGFHLG